MAVNLKEKKMYVCFKNTKHLSTFVKQGFEFDRAIAASSFHDNTKKHYHIYSQRDRSEKAPINEILGIRSLV